MSERNKITLLSLDLKRIVAIPCAYTGQDMYPDWSGYMYNGSTETVTGCRITTHEAFSSVLALIGGNVVEYTPITANPLTTCNIGDMPSDTRILVGIRISKLYEFTQNSLLLIPITIFDEY